MPLRRDVVGPHDVAASDARVGGHGRGLQARLRVVQGASAVCAVDAAVPDPAAELYLRSVQTCLRVTIAPVLIGHKEVIWGTFKIILK